MPFFLSKNGSPRLEGMAQKTSCCVNTEDRLVSPIIVQSHTKGAGTTWMPAPFPLNGKRWRVMSSCRFRGLSFFLKQRFYSHVPCESWVMVKILLQIDLFKQLLGRRRDHSCQIKIVVPLPDNHVELLFCGTSLTGCVPLLDHRKQLSRHNRLPYLDIDL